MSCTTILVGKNASYDGSTIIARDDDSGSGRYDPKRFVAVAPDDQPRHYRSVLSHVEIELPDNPCRYTIAPNVLNNRGILAEAGANEHNVAMSATETIAVNERVLGADPMVELRPAVGEPDSTDYQAEQPGGIGEEDIITLVLPYVTTAREGVARLGELLETYGTYESNGVIISDVDEIWYVETIGGHHWIARRVPDDCYATIPNQLGIDDFDLADAFGEQRVCVDMKSLSAICLLVIPCTTQAMTSFSRPLSDSCRLSRSGSLTSRASLSFTVSALSYTDMASS